MCNCMCHHYWPNGEPDYVHKGECKCNGDEYEYTAPPDALTQEDNDVDKDS